MESTPNRIRVWNEETREMMEPVTIQEMLCMERNIRITERWTNTSEDPLDPDLLYGHLVFMYGTGIYAQPSKTLVHSTKDEVFAEDLVTHSIAPYVYRVVHELGCWYAQSLCPDIAKTRMLKHVFNPIIVGNIYENRELFMKGEITR